MRGGLTPEEACKKMIERIVAIKKDKVKDIQVAFLAISHRGEVGAFSIHPGFTFAFRSEDAEELKQANSWFK
jgi:N4-(beta-N-acetylglucosaminyl)-L-asparaginase